MSETEIQTHKDWDIFASLVPGEVPRATRGSVTATKCTFVSLTTWARAVAAAVSCQWLQPMLKSPDSWPKGLKAKEAQHYQQHAMALA